MIRVYRVTAACAAAVATGCAGSAPMVADAAESAGVFRYQDAQAAARSVTNPAPGWCLRTRNAIRAVNDTGRPVELYSSPDCSGLVRTVEPGGDFSGDFHSAMVVPR